MRQLDFRLVGNKAVNPLLQTGQQAFPTVFGGGPLCSFFGEAGDK